MSDYTDSISGGGSRALYATAVAEGVETYFQQLDGQVGTWATNVEKNAGKGELSTKIEYGSLLTSEIQRSAHAAVDQMIVALQAKALSLGQRAPDATEWARIRAILVPSVVVVNKPKDRSIAEVGGLTIAGASFGSIIPVVGTLAGALGGFAAGMFRKAHMDEKRSQEIKASISIAAHSAMIELRTRRQQAIDAILNYNKLQTQ